MLLLDLGSDAMNWPVSRFEAASKVDPAYYMHVVSWGSGSAHGEVQASTIGRSLLGVQFTV